MTTPEPVPDLPTLDECEVCLTDAEDVPGGALSRCSVCKNRFYCVRALAHTRAPELRSRVGAQSTRCQKADWRAHKHSCSARAGPLPAPECTLAQLDTEVARASTLLLDDDAACLREYALPPALAYARDVPGGPAQCALISLARVFFIHLVAGLSAAECDTLAVFASDASLDALGVVLRHLDGAKLVARPGALAPAEYAGLVQLMWWLLPHLTSPDPEVRARWDALASAMQRAYEPR
jgi:hypothetical protein